MNTGLLDKEQNTPVSTGEDDLRQYLQEIRRFPRLTPEEENALAQRCAQGDEDAIRQMVNANLRLVVSVAREYAGRGVPLLDLIQEGSIGLLVAARKFDHTRNLRFSTYATKWIRQGVGRCLNSHGSLIRIPPYSAERIRKIQQVKAAFLQEHGYEPTPEEIARCCDIPADKIRQLLRLAPEVCSLDVPAGEGEEDTLASLLRDAQAPQPQEALIRRELEQTMDYLLGALNDRQREILRLHFGMEDGICCSLEEISHRMGISKERVRQIEKQAMEKLQKMGADMGLEDFLE